MEYLYFSTKQVTAQQQNSIRKTSAHLSDWWKFLKWNMLVNTFCLNLIDNLFTKKENNIYKENYFT